MTSLPRRHVRASNFRPPKSRLGLSEKVQAKSDATVRFELAILNGLPRFATIRDRRRIDRRVTDMRTDGSGRSRAIAYYYIDWYYLPFGQWQSIIVRHFCKEDAPSVTHGRAQASRSSPVSRRIFLHSGN